MLLEFCRMSKTIIDTEVAQVQRPSRAALMRSGTAAALGQALIPYYTGVIIDYASIDPDAEAFQWTCVKLIAVAFGCAIFTGVRGGLFTVCVAPQASSPCFAYTC